MSLVIKAIYENGLFRPLEVVSLDEHVTVSLIVHTASAEKDATSKDNTGSEFDSQLENLLFDGPSLPEHFSRADIYADHD